MKLRIHILFLFTLIMSLAAVAAPVHERAVILLQPDGTSFHAVFRGDEFIRIKTDMDGHAIVQNADGWWHYAEYDGSGRKVDTGYRVGDKTPASVLVSSRNIPYQKLSSSARIRRRLLAFKDNSLLHSMRTAGAVNTRSEDASEKICKHGIVILAQFADVSFKYTKDDFVRLLTQAGYSRDGGAGCAKEYFDAQFNGQIDFDFVVSDVVTLSHDRAFYGENVTDSYGNENDKAPEEMLIEACRLVDEEVDFSLYDDDGDGEVDNVFVFFAGGDEAEGAGDDCIWSHAWYLRDGAGRNLELDGMVINRYACTSEMTRYVGASGRLEQRLAGIGTFCHEYSHTFGLVDMYDTDYDGSGGVADALWLSTSLMDGGNQNNGGTAPPYFNAIERMMLGISVPEVISSGGVYRLSPIHQEGRCYRINTDHEDEFYLLECRSAEGWDAHIGGRGLLVYHIDMSDRDAGYSEIYDLNTTAYSRWNIYNEVNCRPDHQCADLIEAMPDAYNVRNVFYPVSGVNVIESLVSWSGAECEYSISGIRFDGNDIVFNVLEGDSDTTPPAAISIGYEKFQDAAIVTFESSRYFEGEATVTWGQTGKKQETVKVAPYEPGKYAVVLEGLSPRTSYTVNMVFSIDGLLGKDASISFMTSSDSNGHPYIYLKNVKRNQDGTFPAGARIPLRVFNAVGAEKVDWTYDGKHVTTGPDGYFHLEKSGTLKATACWEDGSEDVIIKEIKVKQ